MSEAPEHPAVRQYLDDLRKATRDLPPGRQRELLAEIEEHLAETAPLGASETQVHEAIERLGDPQQIAAAERERHQSPDAQPSWREWLAIPLLLVGGIAFLGLGALLGAPGRIALPGIGWLTGVLLLWLSKIWTVRDKLLGTLVVPGGLLPVAYLTLTSVSVETCAAGAQGVQRCTGGISTPARVALITLWVVLLAAPLATGLHLGRQLRNK
jgi:uncharacterized membrane protein